jgi:ThiF family
MPVRIVERSIIWPILTICTTADSFTHLHRRYLNNLIEQDHAASSREPGLCVDERTTVRLGSSMPGLSWRTRLAWSTRCRTVTMWPRAWDGDPLAKARVLVAGAGALGNESLKNKALPGVKCIRVLDRDHVDAPSDLFVHGFGRHALYETVVLMPIMANASFMSTSVLSPTWCLM